MLAAITQRFPPLDAPLEAAMRLGSELSLQNPIRTVLARHRRATGQEVTARYRPALLPLEAGVLAREPDAIARYDALVGEAVATMRSSRPAGVGALLGFVEQALYRNGDELLDNPTVPQAIRVHVLDVLDRFNEHLGSYARWTALIDELASAGSGVRSSAATPSPPGARPLSVVELAAGHGSFSLQLARHFGAGARVTATDLRDEYLALGRPRAAALGLDVAFVAQDATNLSNYAPGDVDIFVCTQSLHHFPPGMVSRMMGEAARAARLGLCFIDAERGVLPLLLVSPLLLAYGRSWPVLHDTVTSLRRMYYEEELALLAALAPALPAHTHVESGRRAPGFAYVRLVNRTGVTP